MLIVFRTVCGVGSPVLFLTVGTSGVETVAWGLGVADGREGAFSLDGVCGRLFLTGFAKGRAGRGEVGGSAVGRVRTGKDISSL